MSFEIISTAAGFIQFTDLGVGPVALDLGFFQIRWYSLVSGWHLAWLLDVAEIARTSRRAHVT